MAQRTSPRPVAAVSGEQPALPGLACCHPGCSRPVYIRETCRSHYEKARRAGRLAELPTGRSSGWHMLADVDMLAKTATCSQCGPVRVSGNTRENASCGNHRRNLARKSHRAEPPEVKKNYKLQWKYGISLADYEAMLAAQERRCAICGEEQLKALAVDHDHVRGEVRGLLCSTCNSGLGHFKDSIENLRNAIRYLEQHGIVAA